MIRDLARILRRIGTRIEILERSEEMLRASLVEIAHRDEKAKAAYMRWVAWRNAHTGIYRDWTSDARKWRDEKGAIRANVIVEAFDPTDRPLWKPKPEPKEPDADLR